MDVVETVELELMEESGKIFISADSLIKTFEVHNNRSAVGTIKHFIDEYHLHKQGLSINANSIFRIEYISDRHRPDAPPTRDEDGKHN